MYRMVVLLLALVLLAPSAQADRPTSTIVKPDIVVIMADDLDEHSLQRMLDLGLLPNINKYFIHGGTRFRESFVTNSLCCPSRATFLTGQYSHNHGVLSNDPPNGGFPAFDNTNTLAVWLQSAGYRTGHVGKFLNGYGSEPPKECPACNPSTYVPPGWNDWQGLVGGSTYCVYNYTVNDNGALRQYGSAESDYQTDVLAQRAVDFVGESAVGAAPFFLVVTPLVPHFETCQPSGIWVQTIRPAPRHAGTLPSGVGPETSKPSYNEFDVSDKPSGWDQRWPLISAQNQAYLLRQYRMRLEALRALDDLVGSLMIKLQTTGRFDKTQVIFTADNGWIYGEHRATGKVLSYEESIRVPLLMRGRGVPANNLVNAIALNTDLAPTILNWAGATPGRTQDGRSLVPLLTSNPAVRWQRQPPATWRQRFLIEHFAVADGPEARAADLDIFSVRTSPADTLAAPSSLYSEYERGDTYRATEQYRLDLDPYQIASVHAQGGARAEERARLNDFLDVLKSCGKPGQMPCAEAEAGLQVPSMNAPAASSSKARAFGQ